MRASTPPPLRFSTVEVVAHEATTSGSTSSRLSATTDRRPTPTLLHRPNGLAQTVRRRRARLTTRPRGRAQPLLLFGLRDLERHGPVGRQHVRGKEARRILQLAVLVHLEVEVAAGDLDAAAA